MSSSQDAGSGADSGPRQHEKEASGQTRIDGDSATPAASTNAQFAQALKDLARGEQAAASLEASLTSFESKLNDILAAFEGIEEDPGEEEAVSDTADGKKSAEKQSDDKKGP